jgi:hypothetical protein
MAALHAALNRAWLLAADKASQAMPLIESCGLGSRIVARQACHGSATFGSLHHEESEHASFLGKLAHKFVKSCWSWGAAIRLSREQGIPKKSKLFTSLPLTSTQHCNQQPCEGDDV